METVKGNRLSISGQTDELGKGVVSKILKQARSIRFMEELQDWDVITIADDWQSKRQALLAYVSERIGELSKENTAPLVSLRQAISDMERTLQLPQ